MLGIRTIFGKIFNYNPPDQELPFKIDEKNDNVVFDVRRKTVPAEIEKIYKNYEYIIKNL